jgi:type III secretory pathway lipoprotein EscJ
MKWLMRHLRQIRGRLAGMDARSGVLVVAMVVLALAGGAWLVYEGLSTDPPASVAQALTGPQLRRARDLLRREGIDFEIRDGKLYVPEDQVRRVSKLLIEDDLAGGRAKSDFEELADEAGLWRTGAQNQRRWQARKMAELGRLIAQMTPLASASVLFEPGTGRTLGASSRPATAAVKVTLAEDHHISPTLVVAIAELVSGSVAGLAVHEVRIVDDAGVSYRAETDTLALVRRNAAEAFYRQKINAALHYISGLAADVQMGNDSAGSRVRAWVSVPSTYLQDACGPVGRTETDPARLREAFGRQLADIQRSVMRVLETTRAQDVMVTWHRKTPAGKAAPKNKAAAYWLNAGLAVLAVGAAVVLGLVLLRRRRGAPEAPLLLQSPLVTSPSDETSDADPKIFADVPLATQELMLPSGVDREALIKALDREHPQTLALILAYLPPEQAAEILAHMPADRRVEVAGRMADLGQIDPQVVAEIKVELSARLSPAGVSAAGEAGGGYRPPGLGASAPGHGSGQARRPGHFA